MPFRTAIPKSAIRPTEADRLSVRPRIQSAAIPPTAANGTFIRISKAQRTRRKVTYSSPKMIAMDSGTTSASRDIARAWFSNCPPQVR